MKKEIPNTAFKVAENKLNKIISIATSKGGFDKLTAAEAKALAKQTKIVEGYEAVHYTIPMPESEGLIALKMYEKN